MVISCHFYQYDYISITVWLQTGQTSPLPGPAKMILSGKSSLTWNSSTGTLNQKYWCCLVIIVLSCRFRKEQRMVSRCFPCTSLRWKPWCDFLLKRKSYQSMRANQTTWKRIHHDSPSRIKGPWSFNHFVGFQILLAGLRPSQCV